MMMFLVTMSVLLVLTADISYVFKKRSEFMLPVSFGVICIWEYLCALAGLLRYSAFLFVFALVCFNAYMVVKKKVSIESVKNFFSPGIVCFILCGIVFWIYHAGKITRGGDEYSAWAITVKHMFYKHKLPCQGESSITFNTYAPGAALIKYFFMRLQGVYTDSLLYKIHSLWTISMFIPMFGRMTSFKKKEIPEYFCIGLICLLLPMLFFTECYTLLTVDCLLAMLFAYGIFLIFGTEHDKGFYVALSFAMMMLVLTKTIGLVLAGVLVFILLVDNCIMHKEKSFLRAVSLSAVALGTYLSWSVYVKIWDPVVDGRLKNMNFSVKPLLELMTGKADSVAYDIIKKFCSAFFRFADSRQYNSALPITGAVFCVITVVGLLYIKKYHGGKRTLGMGISFLFGMFLYYLMILYTYVYTFNDTSGLALNSYKRYTATWWMGLVVALLMLIIYNGKIWIRYLCYGVVILCMIWGIRRIYTQYGQGYYGNALSLEIKEQLSNLSGKYLDTLDPDDGVYIIAQDNGSMYLQAAYLLTPIRYNPDQVSETILTSSYSLGVNEEIPELSTDYSVEEWKEVLRDYDYVYVCVTNDYLIDRYGELFEDKSAVVDDTMFYIDESEDGDVKLVKVE